MEFADLALGKCEDRGSGEVNSFEEAGDVFLIAADAIQRFGVDDIEGTACRVLHEQLYARPHQSCPRDRSIIVDLYEFVFVPFKPFAA